MQTLVVSNVCLNTGMFGTKYFDHLYIHVVHNPAFVPGTLTCPDILLLGSSASVLGASHINGLSTGDFDDCAETLGSISTWGNSALLAMANKAKEVLIKPIKRKGSNHFNWCS